jgi:putative ATP-binding cassette transporter
MSQIPIDIIKFIYKEAEGSKLALFGMSMASGMTRGLLLATINASAANTFAQGSGHLYIANFLFFLLLYVISSYYVKVQSSAVIEKARQDLTNRLCNKLILTELNFIESYGRSELYQKLRLDVNMVCNVATSILTSTQSAVLLFFCLVYIAWLVPVALFFTLVGIALGLTVYLVQNKRILDTVRLARKAAVDFGEQLRDLVGGFKELKVNHSKRSDFNNNLLSVTDKFRKLNTKVAKLETVSFLTTQIFIFLLIAVVVFLLPVFQVIDKTVIFQFFASILFLIGPLESLISSYQNISKASISLENIYGLENDINKSLSELVDSSRIDMNINFDQIKLDNIHFHYQKNNNDKFVIGPINLTIRRGEILFIAGGNGTGKTTLLKIITGLYIPTEGEIRINGDILTIENYQSYREMFSTIFTDFHVFRKLYGVSDIDQDKLSAILHELKLDDKTAILDGEFDSSNLSRGQKKRFAYMISYLDNRQIYVFDEFAADQDPGFKKYFYYTILPSLKAEGKTVIAVTHDDNYFDACDRLVKMDYGKIVDSSEYEKPAARINM